MKNINWKVRLQHKPFLIALFSAILILAQQVLAIVGIDTSVIEHQATDIFNSILAIAVILGVVIDPTTSNIQDSSQAMNYKEPK